MFCLWAVSLSRQSSGNKIGFFDMTVKKKGGSVITSKRKWCAYMCPRLLLDIRRWPPTLSCSSNSHAFLLRRAPDSHRASSQPFLRPCLFLTPLTPPPALLHTLPHLLQATTCIRARYTLQCGVARALAWCCQIAGQCPATFPLTSPRGAKMH